MPLWFELGVLVLLAGIVFYLGDIHSHLQDIRDVLASRRDKGNSIATLTDE
jgi:hypothetical protein